MIANIEPYRIFPRATHQERAELRASIETVGLSCQIVADEHGEVIDGHERRDICVELDIDWMAGASLRIGLDDNQKKALAIELNLWRRPIQLTRNQRNELIDIYVMANSHLSETVIAELFGVDQSTVNRRRKALMQSHKLPKVVETVGKDGITRKVGNRSKQARMIVKSRAEFESLQPALKTLSGDLSGDIRRPKKLVALARRKTALIAVNSAPKSDLPSEIRIEHSDFHDLQIEEESVDVILTDVVWQLAAEPDWRDLAKLATKWLKEDGVFCSFIGNYGEARLYQVLAEQLLYQATVAIVFPTPSWPVGRGIGKQWRPAVVFAKSKRFILPRITDVIFVPQTSNREKDYHDWQQRLDVSMELMQRLSKPGNVILDPHLGTGTNAVAASLLGNRTFIGCDIDEQQVKTARYRVATEGNHTTGDPAEAPFDIEGMKVG